MPFDKDQEQETQGLDIEAATAEISSDLFGQGGDEEGGEGPEGEEDESSSDGSENVDATDESSSPTDEAPVEEETVLEGEVVEENAESVQAVGAPKTWTKEALEKWATVDPVVQAEVLKREEDFLKGITAYKGAADLGVRYSQVVEPYAPMLAAENVDPVQLFQSFAANHYLLSKGSPAQKVKLAAELINGYEIPLADLLNHIAEEGTNEPVDPKIAALEKEIAELKGVVTTRQTAEQSAAQAKIDAEIDAFAADPAHPYFDEVAADISNIFKAGAASTLSEAYEKAVWANPSTRQKELDRIKAESLTAAAEEEKARLAKKAKSTADSVEVSERSKNGTVPTGSMDDTLSETMASISSRA